MRLFKDFIRRLHKFIRWFRKDKPNLEDKGHYVACYVDDFPEIFENKVVYFLGSPRKEWLAGFLCPCGCCNTIELVLSGTQHPCWKADVSDDGMVTFFPSVWRNIGCKSHFFLINGRISWR